MPADLKIFICQIHTLLFFSVAGMSNYEVTRLRSTVEMLDLVNHRYSANELIIYRSKMEVAFDIDSESGF